MAADESLSAASLPDPGPWRVVMSTAAKGKDGLLQSSRWLCLFARSGVEIPVAMYMEFFALAEIAQLSVAEMLILLKACVHSLWLQSIGRQELLEVFSNLHRRLAPGILAALQGDGSIDDA